MKKVLSLLIVFTVFFISESYGTLSERKICLNMIVKDESKVIERCLKSVIPIIDYWVIVDTGSTDGTQEIIKKYMKDIPGELHEEPWQNFEYNRNHALKLTKDKADYVFFIDADEQLRFDKDFMMPKLEKDFYHVMIEYGGSRYTRVLLIKSCLDWEWKGVVHEALYCDDAKSSGILKSIANVVTSDGCRSYDPSIFLKDAKLLEDALKKDPKNTRNAFYLAQSYRDAGKHLESIKAYEKRSKMGGWDQEVFWSLYQIGLMRENLKMDLDSIEDSYYAAYVYRPNRAEPLYRLANYYRMQGKYNKCYAIAKLALTIPYPSDLLFVEDWIYQWGLLMEYSVSAYWSGKYLEALSATNKLKKNPNIPDYVVKQADENLKWINQKLSEKFSDAKIAVK